jgi:hypothetical protein
MIIPTQPKVVLYDMPACDGFQLKCMIIMSDCRRPMRSQIVCSNPKPSSGAAVKISHSI